MEEWGPTYRKQGTLRVRAWGTKATTEHVVGAVTIILLKSLETFLNLFIDLIILFYKDY